MAEPAQATTPAPADLAAVEYRCGDEFAPARWGGRIDLTVRADGALRVTHHEPHRVRGWTAVADPAVWPRLVAALTAAGFPGVRVPAVAAGLTLRTLRVRGLRFDGTVRIGWADPAGVGLGPACAILDALVAQASDGQAPGAADRLPRMVHRVRVDARFAGPGLPAVSTAAFGTRHGAPVAAVARADDAVRLFTVPDGACVAESAVRPAARAVVVGPAGSRELFATGGDDHVVRAWDATGGESLHARQGHRGPVRCLLNTRVAGSDLLFSGASDADVRVWGLNTAVPLGGLLADADETAAVTALVDGGSAGSHWLAAGYDDGTVRMWDAESGRPRHTVSAHEGSVTALATVAGAAGVLATGGTDRVVRVWDMRTGRLKWTLTGAEQTVTGLASVRSAGRDLVVACGLDGFLRVWDTGSGESVGAWSTGHGWLCGIIAVPGPDPLVATVGADDTVAVWDVASGRRRSVLGPPAESVAAVTSMAVRDFDGRVLVAGGRHDGTVVVWDLAAPDAPPTCFPAAAAPVPVTAVTLAGGHLPPALNDTDDTDDTTATTATTAWTPIVVCGTRDGEVLLHRADTGALVGAPSPHTGQVHALALARVDDRSVLVSAGADHTVRAWDAESGMPLLRLSGHSDTVSALTVGEIDGEPVIASAGHDCTIRTWRARTGQPLLEIFGHDFPVRELAFGTVRGEAVIASAGHDGDVRITMAATGELSTVLHGNNGLVRALGLCTIEEHTVLAVGTDDRMLRLWMLPEGGLIGERELARVPLAVLITAPETVCVATEDGVVVL